MSFRDLATARPGWLGWAATALFALLLALRIAGGLPILPEILAATATVAFLAAAWNSMRWMANALRGPAPGRRPAGEGVQLAKGPSGGVLERALRRADGEGAGYVERWRAWVPAVSWGAVTCALLSGLLNVGLHIEGTWLQYAMSAIDLDRRATFESLDLGVFADPGDLKFGVAVNEVRPGTPDRLFDLKVVDSRGTALVERAASAHERVAVAGMDLFAMGFGPGIHLTVLQREMGRLFDGQVPLLPGVRAGTFAATVGADGSALEVRVADWPWAEGVEGRPLARLTVEGKVVLEAELAPRRVVEGKDGYAVIAWELRPYLRMGVAHRTFRAMTLWSMAAAVLALLLGAFFRPRPYWYREDGEGSLTVWPASAGAALAERWPG